MPNPVNTQLSAATAVVGERACSLTPLRLFPGDPSGDGLSKVADTVAAALPPLVTGTCLTCLHSSW